MATVLDSHKRGDTWLGISEVAVTINGDPLDLTGASIAMQLRKGATHPDVALEFSTENGLIVITDAGNGTFSIEPCIIEIPAYTYVYDIEVTTAAGRVLTVVEGTWEIENDVTRP